MSKAMRTTRYILTILLSATMSLNAVADGGYAREYTENAPLVYEDAWDLWPYSFINSDGEPDGFNIELLHIILKELDIPYVIKLKPTQDALNDLKAKKSDLMLGMDADFHNEYGLYGQSIVKIFTHSVVYPKSQAPKKFTFQDLATHKVIVHTGSFSHHLMIDHGWGDNAIGYDDMKQAMQDVNKEKQGFIVWNTISLKWLLYDSKLTNLDMMPVEMPSGEYKFMSTDPYLLSRLDSVYTDLFSTDELQALQNKWFYPEYTETGIPSWVWHVAGLLGAIALGLLLSLLIYRRREQKMTRLLQQSNARLSLVLQTSGVALWTYDVASGQFFKLDKDGKPQKEQINAGFARRLPQEQLERILESLRQLSEGEKEKNTLEMQIQKENDANTLRDVIVSLSVLRKDNKGKPSVLLGTLGDITEERRKQQNTRDIMTRYQSVFNTSSVDQLYFNEEGILTNLNEKACETYGLTKEEMLAKRITVHDIIQDEKSLDDFDYFYATLQTERPSREHKGETESFYYELQLVPVYDDNHKLLAIYGTGEEVTETVNVYRQSRHDLERLKMANKDITDYVHNINFALKNGGVRISIYSPETHMLTIYSQMDTVEHSFTQTRCLEVVEGNAKLQAVKIINAMDACTPSDFDTTLPIVRGEEQPNRIYMHLHFIPITDERGRVVSYFGMCRDVSKIKTTELLLEQETKHAQKTEAEKNEFMRNMSYEIRTPLNVVVGFAELFEKDHTAEEESIFAREIKNNSGKLLELINNILFISRLDAQMIEITPRPVNLAEVFEMYCQDGWARRTAKGVKCIVENPYRRLVVDVDEANLGHVIRQLTANAALYTQQGTIHARYDYIDDQLIVTIDDTGSGIPQEQLTNIYDRFVSGKAGGTGLGLSICWELMRRMGGSIKMKSKLGVGTTVWITLPCQATEIERN